MRRLIKTLCAIALASLAVFALGSCGEGEHSVCHFTKKVVSEDYFKEEATCAHPALYYYSCSCGRHGNATFESGKALPHTFTCYSSDNNATCTADGTKSAKCDKCSATDTVSDVGTTLPHSFTNYVYNGNATCGADGTKTAKCDGCDATDEIKAEKTKLEHEYSREWSKNETHHWHASLCEHGAKANEAKHKYEGGACKVCGQSMPDVFIESFKGAIINGKNVSLTVSEADAVFTVKDKIVCSENAAWELYSDAECLTRLDANAALPLSSGDNVYYVKVFLEEPEAEVLYRLTVHRSYKVTVTYKRAGAVLKSVTAYSGAVFTADYTPDAPRGYTFDCWLLGDDEFYSGIITSDITLNAHSVPNTYSITLDPNGGTVASTEITVTYGLSYRLGAPQKSGYAFVGWFDSDGVKYVDGVWEGLENITLIAKWTKFNGGSGIQMPFVPLV